MKTYRQVVRFLKDSYPAEHPVKVRRLKLGEDLDGDCRFSSKEHFIIRINRNLPEHEAIDVLIHEWAHAIAWEKCSNDEHCDEWGKAYSRVYRHFLRHFLDKTS